MLGGCFLSFHLGVKAMNQNKLDREIARATGESLSTIRSLGFSVADPDNVSFDPEPEQLRCRPRILNWDRLDAKRGSYLPQRSRCRKQA